MLRKWISAAAMAFAAGAAQSHTQTEITRQHPYPERFTQTHNPTASEITKNRSAKRSVGQK